MEKKAQEAIDALPYVILPPEKAEVVYELNAEYVLRAGKEIDPSSLLSSPMLVDPADFLGSDLISRNEWGHEEVAARDSIDRRSARTGERTGREIKYEIPLVQAEGTGELVSFGRKVLGNLAVKRNGGEYEVNGRQFKVVSEESANHLLIEMEMKGEKAGFRVMDRALHVSELDGK